MATPKKTTIKIVTPVDNVFDATILSYALTKLETISLSVGMTKKGVELITTPSQADLARAIIDSTLTSNEIRTKTPKTGVTLRRALPQSSRLKKAV